MRNRYVVQVVPEENQPERVVVSSVPSVSASPLRVESLAVASPPSQPPVWSGQAIDVEKEERLKQERVKQVFQEETFKTVQEQVLIHKPRTSRRRLESNSPVREDAFRRHLHKPAESERIERLYRQRQEIDNPKKPRVGSVIDFGRVFNFAKTGWLVRGTIVVFAVIILLSGALFGTTFYVKADLGATQREVASLLTDLNENRLTSAKERLGALKVKKNRYERLYSGIRPAFRFVQGKEKATHVDQIFEITNSGLHIIETGLDSYSVIELGYRQFLGQEEGKSVETFSEVAGRLEVLFTELSSLQAKIARLENPYQIGAINDLRTNLNARVPRLRKYFLSAQQLTYVLPEILGDGGGKRQYLVLLQNNAELRPTGGFIGSFAIITVENGKFIDFRVEDVYEADGQLNGYVAPPKEITQYLGEAQWFLRDVNWSPDFPTVAAQAAWFLDKELGIKPDGVIGINLAVVQKLLDVTGPVNLVDYNEIITKDNLYERAQQHAELNFFPGSTQKRDFLSAVASALFDRLTREDSSKMLIIKSLVESADESELIVSINQDQARDALANLGWDGSLHTPDCPAVFSERTCVVDTVMQVEANVGVNKANQFIERSINHQVKLNGSMANHDRTIVLRNTADSNAWPEGSYKSYFRLFVTKGARLDSVTINGNVVDLGGVSVAEELDKTVFGFLINVPIKSTYEVRMAYSVAISPEQALTYALFEQKQPGAGLGPMETHITVEDRQVSAVAPEPEITGRTMSFSSNRRQHQFIAVETR